ncbi:hypothetical protein [Mycobacteroides salmoniphilum]|uniref:GP55 protein n=1 Tax=Mycobacteroides salmoniphilum TaxID=404941 RepID=A0A4R8SBV3_9MYCO|nr:hypothetical protein [Mycobacteroides salmoniphilum]TDZ92080.1 hypothetical protein CCUG60885_04194 [Mycobacteroides salmoniphilum]TEA07311.1 hypothetical protein CCUG60883_01344 [Mycobacteroides salmoniphilum]
MHAALIMFTIATISWSLWVRRLTWTCNQELAASLNIALQGGAVILMSPFASETVGAWLHKWTGMHNLEDLIAHDLYIIAASAIIIDALYRLDVNLEEKFRKFVELPATLVIPAMITVFTAGDAVDDYRADFFRLPVTDWWMMSYWLILCGMLAYLLLYSFRALVPLWRERESRLIASVYMFATASGVTACGARIITAQLPLKDQDTLWASMVVWTPAALCGTIFAAAAGRSWIDQARRLISA